MPTSSSIRAARLEDAAKICSIYNNYILTTCISFEEAAVSEEEMRRRIEEVLSYAIWLVVENELGVVGYAYATHWRPRSAYRFSMESTVYLAAGVTGQGLGSQLYKRLIEQVRERGVHSLVGGIALPNAASVKLHEKLGFKKVAQFEQIGWKFDRWIDVGYWQLRF